jgi:hypothetical protein
MQFTSYDIVEFFCTIDNIELVQQGRLTILIIIIKEITDKALLRDSEVLLRNTGSDSHQYNNIIETRNVNVGFTMFVKMWTSKGAKLEEGTFTCAVCKSEFEENSSKYGY